MVKRASSLGQPLKTIIVDYADVFADIYKSSVSRPFRTLAYIAMGTTIITVALRRPGYTEYMDNVVNSANELGMCSEMVRNPVSKNYIDSILSEHSNGRLSCVNLGLVSIIVRREVSNEVCNYQATCKWLQPRPWSLLERVVDCGAWGHWWGLENAMVDYDINTTELESLND